MSEGVKGEASACEANTTTYFYAPYALRGVPEKIIDVLPKIRIPSKSYKSFLLDAVGLIIGLLLWVFRRRSGLLDGMTTGGRSF